MLQERLFLFRELICKDVDWTGLGMPAYSCFSTFFSCIWSEAGASTSRMSARTGAKVQSTVAPAASVAGAGVAPTAEVAGTAAALAEGVVPSPAVEASEATEDLTDLGVDTLWLVTLTSLNKEVADSATMDLLSVSLPLFDRAMLIFEMMSEAVQTLNTVVIEKTGQPSLLECECLQPSRIAASR